MAGALTDGCSSVVQSPWQNPKLTIGEAYDLRIEQARKIVERLCIQKAKLEAMNLLNYPYVEMRDLINGEMF